jgi:hypothetical protein
MDPRIRSIVIAAALCSAWAASERAQAQSGRQCAPPCRSSYVCVRGECVSSCNPPCGEGEKCTADGECVSASGAPAPSEPPGPAPSAEESSRGEAWGASGAPGDAAGATQSSGWIAPPAAGPTGPAAGPAPDAREEGPFVSFLIGVGPTISWWGGGHLELGGAIKLTRGIYLASAVHVSGGGGYSGNSFVSCGGDVGVRLVDWRPFGWVAHFGAGGAFIGEFESASGEGLIFEYAAPYVRLGGGVQFTRGERFAWGVEGTARVGYAAQNQNRSGDYYRDQSGFFASLNVSLVLTI